jgi:hypothetical protein
MPLPATSDLHPHTLRPDVLGVAAEILPINNRRTEEVAMEWKNANPVFPVADVAASIAWYRRMFDFEPRIVNPPGDDVPVYAVLYRDAVSIHLLRKDEAPHGLTGPVQAQFWISDGLDDGLDALFERVTREGDRC